MRIQNAILFCAIVVLALSERSSAQAPSTRQWQIGGVKREAITFAPADAKEVAAPVVFAFHGHGGNSKNVARSMNFQTHWPEAIVVYMQGLNTPGRLTDPMGKKPGWQHSAEDQQGRDLKFFDAVLSSLKSEYKVDTQRIYSTGHSNGGGFTYLLWNQRGDLFAAIAPSASAAGRRDLEFKPLPILHVAGTTDPLVKYEWQKLMMELVKKVNDCEAKGEPWEGAGKLDGTIYPSKTGTPLVTLVHPGGHQYLPETPKLIVKFFKEHSRPELAKQ